MCRFDPSSTQFTLESVVSLRLDQHCDFIAELSVTASKEQAIETSLANIAATWAELRLDMADYKGTYKLRSTEDIFTALEDNGVILSTMKASKYYLVFEQQVAHWERTLALASETVEMILQVCVLHAVCTCRPDVCAICCPVLFSQLQALAILWSDAGCFCC
jgi:dynein heavy chain